MTYEVKFPGVGTCCAALWHDAQPAHAYVSRQAYGTVEDGFDKIKEARRFSIYFPDEYTETIYGKTYSRINVQINRVPHAPDGYSIQWQGHSKDNSNNYGRWHLTDAAQKVMNDRHATMLRKAAPALFAALIPHTQAEWLEMFAQTIAEGKARLTVFENSVKKLQKNT